jgi:hypothetical protein
MKKLIERNLPFSKEYSVLNISITGMDTDWCSCDNCGRPIANKAIIIDAEGIQFVIGLDCLKTLFGAQAIEKSSYLTSADEYEDASRVATFVGFAQNAHTGKDWLTVTATKNGKTKECPTVLVKRYAPDFFERSTRLIYSTNHSVYAPVRYNKRIKPLNVYT